MSNRRQWRFGAALFLFLVGSLLTAAALRMTPPSRAMTYTDLVLYSDSLAAGWQDWSWNSAIQFDNAAPVRSGVTSVAVTYQTAWAGLSLRTAAPVDGALYSGISFWVHGGTDGARQLRFFVQPSESGASSPGVAIDAPANQWTKYSISMEQLGNPAAIGRLNWQDRSGGAQPTFYLDDIVFVAGSAFPEPCDHATIRIDTTGSPIAIDPRIRGTNLPTWLGPTYLSDATFRARTVAAGVTMIRMPGGSWSNSYGWLSCELRANQPNALPCGAGWETWVARPTDYINFLRATNTQGMWVVNPNGTPQEAAAAVAFFNALPSDTTVIGVDRSGFDWQTAGDWAQLRADHGNPEPLGVQLWGLGNEVYGAKPSTGGSQCQPFGWEDVWTCDGTEYATGARGYDGYNAFRAAMRAVDSTIQVGAVGHPFAAAYDNWGAKVLTAAGATMDFYDIHRSAFFQSPSSNAVVLAQPQTGWTAIRSDLTMAFTTYAGGRSIPVGVTGWNLFSVQDQDNEQLMTRAVNALFMADTLGKMAEHGFGIANQWGLANGRADNGTDYGLMHSDNNWYRSPAYYVFPLWARFGGEMLPTTSNLNAATHLSVYGGRIDGDQLSLLAINKSADTITGSIEAHVGSGIRTVVSGAADVLKADSLMAQSVTFNGNSDPADDLSDAPSALLAGGAPFTYSFAPYSVTLLRLQLGSTVPYTPTPTPTATATATPTPTATATPTPEPTATPTIVPTVPTVVPQPGLSDSTIYLPIVRR